MKTILEPSVKGASACLKLSIKALVEYVKPVATEQFDGRGKSSGGKFFPFSAH